MPHDPRHGELGHRDSRPTGDDGASQAQNGSESDPNGGRRRRRAAGEEGASGTHVIDLLSKHGKAPQETSAHRRRAEPEPPSPNGSDAAGRETARPPHATPGAPQPPAPGTSAGHPNGTAPADPSASWPARPGAGNNGSGPNGPAVNGSGPAANGSAPNGPAANGPAANGPAANGPAANGSGPAANGPAASGPGSNGFAAAERPRPERNGRPSRTNGTPPAGGTPSTGAPHPSNPPQAGSDVPSNPPQPPRNAGQGPVNGAAPEGSFPQRPPAPPASAPQNNGHPQPPAGPAAGKPPQGAPAAPPRPPQAQPQPPGRSGGNRGWNPPQSVPQAPAGPAQQAGPSATASPAAPPPPAAPAGGAPQDGGRTPAGPPTGSAPATRITQALNSGASAAPPDADAPTMQHAPVSAPESTPGRSAPAAPPRAAAPPATQQSPPAQPAAADAEVTAQHTPLTGAETALTDAVDPYDDPAEESSLLEDSVEYVPDFDDFDDEDDEAAEDADDERDVEEIDATLARFSAVHDEIAREEEARRNKFKWLRRKGAEPELGKDMPFDFVDGEDGTSRVERKKQRRKRRTHMIIAAVAVAASITVFLTVGMAWSAKTWMNGQFRSISALDPNSGAIQHTEQQTGDQNYLLVGSDTRLGADPADGVGSSEDQPGARSDSIMIAHVPADRSRVVVVSLPRDLRVDLPACQRWDPKSGRYTGERLEPRKSVRLNAAYAEGGPKCTTKAVQQLSGLRITSFLGVDFQGFESMVDSVGGVQVHNDRPIVDEKLGAVLPQVGTHHLSGRQALDYVRARHVEGDPTSDYGRMERQQQFLSALLNKVTDRDVLMDPGKLRAFVASVADNTFGENISSDKLLSLGRSLQGLDPGRVTFTTLPTTGYADDEGMEVPRDQDVQELFDAIRQDVPLDPETGEPATPPSEGSPAEGSPAPHHGQ